MFRNHSAFVSWIVFLGCVLAPFTGLAVQMQENSGIYLIEAERAGTNTETGVNTAAVSNTAASGGALLEVSGNNYNPDPPDKSHPGTVSFTFEPKASGSYALWMRVRPNSGAKSFWVALGDEPYTDLAIGGEANRFRWVCIAFFYTGQGQPTTVKIVPKVNWFGIDCFVAGENSNGAIYTPDDGSFGLSGATVADKPFLFHLYDGAPNYAAAAHLSQSTIDWSVGQNRFRYNTNGGMNNSNNAANALYYLIFATGMDETASATDGTRAKDAALTLFRSLLAGGNEPLCSFSCWWGHPVVSAALLLAKNTPAIYGELTQLERDKADFLQKCLAIAGNWGFNDGNHYETGMDLHGNSGKTWNPNHRAYLMNVLMAALHFGADELDGLFTSFDYDEYMAKIREYGFTNIEWAWSQAGKALMENGGAAFLKGTQGLAGQSVGQAAGTGAGVKLPFRYMGFGLGDLADIFGKFVDDCYRGKVVNSYGESGYIVTGASSPMLGYNGMMREFASSDGGGIRSRAGYCNDSFMFLMPALTNLKLFGVWDSQSPGQQRRDALMYVGNTDFIFKIQQGYQGYSTGSPSPVEYEASFAGSGYLVSKALWQNFHLLGKKDVIIAGAPNRDDLIGADLTVTNVSVRTETGGAATSFTANFNTSACPDVTAYLVKYAANGSLDTISVYGIKGGAPLTFVAMSAPRAGPGEEIYLMVFDESLRPYIPKPAL